MAFLEQNKCTIILSKMTSTYKKHKDGEWITPVLKGYKLSCCDCGLVHNMEFRIVYLNEKTGKVYTGSITADMLPYLNPTIQFRAVRNKRATAQKRRRNVNIRCISGGSRDVLVIILPKNIKNTKSI